jgi:hypothetical protein
MIGELVLVAAGRVIDGDGSMDEVIRARAELEACGASIREDRIAPLRFGWSTPLPRGYRRGACAPIEALIAAQKDIAGGNVDAVLICGRDPIASEFSGRREARDRLMRIYGSRSFMEAYDQLAGAMRARLSLSATKFDRLADCLFENYWATLSQLEPNRDRPDRRWFSKITPHFRGVDCANPNIDFEGAIVVTGRDLAFAAFEPSGFIELRGASVRQRCADGIDQIDRILSYEHLTASYAEACRQADVDLGSMLEQELARLEIYTCFPTVPIAFLLATGLASHPEGIEEFLAAHPATITGGLNLARAPWNNTTLSAIVQAAKMIREGTQLIGIHSNSALGYRQGFALLGAPR